MAYYGDEIIEEVRSRTDIVDLIGQYVHLQKKGANYMGLCPFHSEKTGSFSVSPSKQMYHCFGCGKGGNVYTFLMEYENMTFREAIQELAGRCGVELPKQEMTQEQRAAEGKRSKLLEINKEAATYFYTALRSKQGEKAFKYFEERQLSKETMQKFGLGYSLMTSDDLYKYLRNKGYSDDILKDSGLCTIDERRGGFDKFWNRAMFPIMDVNGKVVAFGGRVMGEGEPKYLNSPETMIFNKSRTLYGLYLAKKSRRKAIILCEGYMDVIALHQAGFDNAAASLGTAFTNGHASMLRRYTDEIYLCYDSDGAGVKAALRAIPILRQEGIPCKVINMRPAKDPDEFMKTLGPEEFEKRIAEAENSFLYTIRMMEADYDRKDPEQKTAFQMAIADKILEFEEEIERNNYLESIANIYNFSYDEMKRLVAKKAAKGGIIAHEERAALKSGMHSAAKKEDGMLKSERLLLTWLCEDPSIFKQVSELITPEDYTEGMNRKVASALYDQLQKNALNPAAIVNMFEEEEEQGMVARIFNTTVGEIESAQDREKALKETVLRVKKNAMEARRKSLDPADPNALMSVVEDKKKLQEMEKISFKLS